MVYPGSSSDQDLNYCLFSTSNPSCAGSFCDGGGSSACRNECDEYYRSNWGRRLSEQMSGEWTAGSSSLLAWSTDGSVTSGAGISVRATCRSEFGTDGAVHPDVHCPRFGLVACANSLIHGGSACQCSADPVCFDFSTSSSGSGALCGSTAVSCTGGTSWSCSSKTECEATGSHWYTEWIDAAEETCHSEGFFECADGGRIRESFFNDTIVDCADSSDELPIHMCINDAAPCGADLPLLS